ncbi:4-coumarate--CoA ligase 1-like [Tropilaelaps mercedesae]|uniref:4-coumarate--CoA ligase 1-like n=1 Tax=Tropilaelaps mercedesae TaxID=418985 RepID=A0A1V9XXC1_9ACAR|nr:4-coumarate--CoA ligase 1-like [Tropilaelaps mercedesae]
MASPSLQNFEVASPLPQPFLPLRSFATELLDRLNRFGCKPCFVTAHGEEISYADVARRSISVAVHLRRIGVRPEQKICLLAETGPQFAWTLLGCLLHSTTVVLACSYRHAISIVDKHGPSAFLFGQSVVPPHRDNVRGCQNTKYVLLESIDCVSESPLVDYISPPYRGSIVTPSLVVYSGGSGGTQRGVILPDKWLHYLLFLQDHGGNKSLLEHKDDVLLLTVPLWRSPGIIILITALVAGCTMIVQQTFEPEESFRLIEKFRISGLPLLAKMTSDMASHGSLAKYDLSSVRFVLSFSGPICSKAWQTLHRHMDIEYIRQVYSLTECLVSTRRRRHAELMNLGPPLPGMRVKIVQLENNEKSSLKVPGMIWVDGECMFLGYLGGETQRKVADSKGWFSTGDIGYYDERGNIHVLDRTLDTFLCQGTRITPVELEDTLRHHPAVKMAVVVGVPVARAGEAARAFIVPIARPEDAHSEGESIRAFIRLRCPFAKQLHGGVEFVRKLPLTEVGRPIRRILKERYLTTRQNE